MYERTITDIDVYWMEMFLDGRIYTSGEFDALVGADRNPKLKPLFGEGGAKPMFIEVIWANENARTRLIKTTKLGRTTLLNRTLWLKQAKAEQEARYADVALF